MNLPPLVRLRPHHPLLYRAADSVQFGAGQRDGVEVVDLSPALWQLLRRLTERPAWTVAELVEEGVRLGAEDDEVRELLADLHAAGALSDDTLVRRRLQARRAAHVLIDGTGPLLVSLAIGLAVDGVGRLSVPAGPGPDALDELEKRLLRVAPQTRLSTAGPRTRPDLAVFGGRLEPDRNRQQELQLLGVPQLLVRVCDEVGLVGPLVLPGRSSCSRCIDLHRAEQDPFWPTLCGQLRAMSGSAGRSTLRATAALAVEQTLAWLDSMVSPGEPPPTVDAVLQLHTRLGELRRRHWPPHPRCGCGASDTLSGLPVRGADTSKNGASPAPATMMKSVGACGATALR
jgi:bacteriocin biosynthesis cyclodehydratase domain-containing protein